MLPYWDNKALPTPTLTLPDTFIFNFLIISFIFYLKEMFFWCDMRFEKGEKKFGKRQAKWASFFSVDYPNHTLVGSVSVNGLCQ